MAKRKIDKNRCIKSIAKRLFQAQGHTGISRADLHRSTELSYKTIDKVFAGDVTVSVYNLKIVADALSVPMRELFNG